MKNYLLALSLAMTLAGCSFLPEPEPAPKQLQLTRLASDPVITPANQAPLRLVVERPQAPLPLQQRDIWYSEQPFQLQAYSRYLWTEGLDRQLQRLVSEFLAAQPWTASVALDTPGIHSDLRLRLTLHHWYLNVPQQKLMLSLQMNLLDSQGRSLLQRNWQSEEPVTPLSPLGFAAASQTWLEAWAQELAELLINVENH